MANAVRFKQSYVARQQGELARLKVVQGPDVGAVYILTGSPATLGRGEENDLVILDLKTSRVHAELSFDAGSWTIKDKGSANGIIYNGKTVREAQLKSQDTVLIGETTLEFITSDVGTMMLMAPPRSVDQIESERKLLEDRAKTQNDLGKKSLLKNPLVLAGGGIVLFLLMFGDGDKKPAETKPKGDSKDNENLAAYLPKNPNPDIGRTAETIFKDGMREYFNGNYTRARIQFETVLQIEPGHSLANLYLENCDRAVKNEVEVLLGNGKKAFVAGKLREAKSYYERIMRLLYKDQSNPAYIEAQDQRKKVMKSIVEGNEFL